MMQINEEIDSSPIDKNNSDSFIFTTRGSASRGRGRHWGGGGLHLGGWGLGRLLSPEIHGIPWDMGYGGYISISFFKQFDLMKLMKFIYCTGVNFLVLKCDHFHIHIDSLYTRRNIFCVKEPFSVGHCECPPRRN